MYFSSTIVLDLIEYATLNGADAKDLKKEADELRKSKHISYEMMVKTLNHIGQELNDENLGLHIGEQISLKVTAYVDSLMQYSDTLEDAFVNAVNYSRLISDALDCTLKKTDNFYLVIFEENPNWKVYQNHAKRQILDLTLLSCLKSLIAYTDRHYYPVEINFDSAKPKNLNEYFRLFNCRLRFNQKKTEIVFEKQIFEKHSKEIKPGLLESLKEKINYEIKNITSENELIYALKKLILKNKPKRMLIEEAASDLHLSKRTLQRKLKELNTSFKEVEYELQLKLAKTYLEEKQKSTDEIGYLLGFSESSAFIRFFKSLTNITPLEYKKTLPNTVYSE